MEALISVDGAESRVAILNRKKLEALFIERSGKLRAAGSIYKGKVEKLLPGMEAAFVDIGLEKDGFLCVSDIADSVDEEMDERLLRRGSIKSMLKEGQEILVQVLKEPIGTKGARLSSYISLPGRSLVLMPGVDHIGVSRKISDEGERKRLKTLLRKIAPSGEGFIVRTAGEGKGEREFKSDIRYLMRTWQAVERRNKRVKAPKLVYEELDVVRRVVRDVLNADIKKIIIDDRAEYNRVTKFVRSLCPDLPFVIELYKGAGDLFETYGVEKEIDRVLSREVSLKSGGYIIIEETQALVSIDVNTGRFTGKDSLEQTVLKTNLEAADEIARQLRLRGLGGIIIIDFIDMKSEGNQKKLLKRLENAVKPDRAKTSILQLSELGLVEMTRQRIRRSLSGTFFEKCPCCAGTGFVKSVDTISIRVQRKLEKICQSSKEKSIMVKVHAKVAERLLNEDRGKITSIGRRFRKRISVETAPDADIEEIQFHG